MLKLEGLWESILALAVEKGRESYGSLCRQYIDSVPFVIVTSREAYEQIIPSKRHRAVGKAKQRG